MKNKILSSLALLCLFVTYNPYKSSGQIYAAMNPDIKSVGVTTGAIVSTVNTDMIEFVEPISGTTQTLTVVTWDEIVSGISTCHLQMESSLGAPVSVTLPKNKSTHPDVVISWVNNYQIYIGVIYENNGTIGLASYLYDLTLPFISLSLAQDNVISTGVDNKNPHIDMHAVYGSNLSGFRLLRYYAAVWQQGTGTYGILKGCWGDLPVASNLGNLGFNIGAYSGAIARNPDISCYSTVTADNIAVIFEKSGGDLVVITQDKMNPSGPVGTTINSAGTYGAPRIESQSHPVLSGSQWQAICPVLSGTVYQARMYGNGIAMFNMSAGINTTPSYSQVAISGGSGGGLGSGFFSDNYVASTRPDATSDANYVYDNIRASSGTTSTGYFETNMTAMGTAPSLPLAVGSSSNSGNYLISAWYNPLATPRDIYYKVTGMPLSFRSTGVNEVSGNGNIKLYPNPADNAITVEGIKEANYNVIDMAGRTMLTGWANGTTSISISSLAAGNYVLQLNEAGTVSARRFTKQ